jgi:hypothetical protein
MPSTSAWSASVSEAQPCARIPVLERARPHPLRNRLAAQAQNDELMKGDDSMLPRGEIGEPCVQRPNRTFVNSWLTKVRFTSGAGRHARTVPDRGAPVGCERYETVTTP